VVNKTHIPAFQKIIENKYFGEVGIKGRKMDETNDRHL
jgi:hypothetical protein